MRINEIKRRDEQDIPDGEIGLFIASMQNMVNKHKSSMTKSTDLYLDVMMKGKFVDWLQDNVVPIWKKHGYPEVGGSQEWGKFEEEVKWKFMIDDKYHHKIK